MYYNYKHYFSIVWQGVSEADYQFICTVVGALSKQSDRGIFESANSNDSGNFHIPEPSHLPVTNVKHLYLMIGDEAYPWLRSFAENNLNVETMEYNEQFLTVRQTIECAFGLVVTK